MEEVVKAFRSGAKFEDYAREVRVHRAALSEQYERLGEMVGEVRADPPLGSMRALVIAEDWCPDCVFNIPVLARIAEASGPACMRIVRRPKYERLADAFPGRGDVSRIPTFIFFDEADSVVGHWSERSARSQQWFDAFTRKDPMPAFEIRDGVPAPGLMAWMERRIALEREQFVLGAWRDVLAEIRAILGVGARHR